MAWFVNNSEMLNTMADLASDPEKLSAFKAAPRDYLTENTDLDDEAVNAIVSHDQETVLRSLMSKVDDET